MKIKNDKELILSLIKDDLIHVKLISGLNALGFDTDSYFLHLSDTIFKLMDFEDNEENENVFERYIQLSEKVNKIDIIKFRERVEPLALEIYTELISSKQKVAMKNPPP